MNKAIYNEVKGGGEWLGAARTWLQIHVRNGDSINWNSTEQVSIPFCDFEDFARVVAIAAIEEDRKKASK